MYKNVRKISSILGFFLFLAATGFVFKRQVPYLLKSRIVKERIMKSEMAIGLESLPASLDPVDMRWAHEVIVFQAIYQTLVRLNDNGEIMPDLADRWAFSDDMKSITFSLNSGAIFSNGERVLPEDVAFSFARHFWPNSNSVVGGLLKDLIEGANVVERGAIPAGIKISENSVTFKLVNHYFPFLLILSMPSFSIVSKSSVLNNDVYLGSGPYIVTARNDDSLLVEKSFNYSRLGAKLKKIQFVPFGDRSNAVKFLDQDKADFVFYGVGTDELPRSSSSDIVVKRADHSIFVHLFVNAKGVLGNDRELREMLFRLFRTFAKESKSKNVTQDPLEFLLPRGFLPPTYYSERPSPVSPEIFKKKYDSISLKLLSVSNLNTLSFFDELTKFLLTAGISLDCTVMPPKEFMATTTNKNSFDLILGGYGANIPDPDGIIDPIFGLSGWSYGNYPTEFEKEKLRRAKFSSTVNERQQSYERIIRDFEAKYYVIPLFQDHIQFIYRSNIRVPPSNYRYESEIWKLFWE